MIIYFIAFLPLRCLDIGQPVNPTNGQIQVDFNLVYNSCTPCARVNFILAQNWNSVNDPNFLSTYNKIVDSLRKAGIEIYALIGHEAVKSWIGDLLRYENPPDLNATNNWINEYVNNFTTIVSYFRTKIKVYESINEPNGMIINNTYFVHPKWFAKILQDIYISIKINYNYNDVVLISGPLLTDDLNKGAGYIDSTYIYGKNIWSWNWVKNLTGSYPLDGIGMHIYVLQNSTNSSQIQNAMLNNINLIWNKITAHEGSNTSKKIWVSEFGWQSSVVGQNGQANNMLTGFNTLNNDSRVRLATWFQLKDFVINNNPQTWGIYDINGNPKQSFNTFKNLNSAYCPGGIRKKFVCAPRNLAVHIITDRYKISADFDNNGLNDIPFVASDSNLQGQAYMAFQILPDSFQCVPISNVHNTSYGISILDFNNDNKKDLVFSAAGNNGVYSLRNNGNWNFTEIQIGTGAGWPNHVAVRKQGSSYQVLYTDEYNKLFLYDFSNNILSTINNECKQGLSVADINGDGSQDVVCGTSKFNQSGYLKFQLSQGNSWSSLYYVSPIAGNYHGIVTADFDKDGKVDIAACNASDNSVHVFRNNGGNPPTFTEITNVSLGATLDRCELSVADIDCDGKLDIVWARGWYGSGPTLGYLKNNWPSWTNNIIENNFYNAYGVTTVYVNGDKRPDIALGLGNQLYIYYNRLIVDENMCETMAVSKAEKNYDKNYILKVEVNKKQIKLVFKRYFEGKIEIYDVLGRLLIRNNFSGYEVSFNVPSSGIYIVKLKEQKLKVLVR
ncbi:MAG: VCBS repeat-containing protein [candidate division WOR-3 bacterium]